MRIAVTIQDQNISKTYYTTRKVKWKKNIPGLEMIFPNLLMVHLVPLETVLVRLRWLAPPPFESLLVFLSATAT